MEKNQNNSSALEYNNIANSDSAALLPHLESFEKMLKLPVVEAAWHQGQDVYGRVKGNSVFLFLFSPYYFTDIQRIFRNTCQIAMRKHAPMIISISKKLPKPEEREKKRGLLSCDRIAYERDTIFKMCA